MFKKKQLETGLGLFTKELSFQVENKKTSNYRAHGLGGIFTGFFFRVKENHGAHVKAVCVSPNTLALQRTRSAGHRKLRRSFFAGGAVEGVLGNIREVNPTVAIRFWGGLGWCKTQ